MATLPGLVIRIGANTKDAIDGLNKVNRAIGKSATGADRLRMSWAKAGPALGAAAAGAALLAAKIGTDAVQAAMQEQRELAKLDQTLGNLGFGAASEQVNAFIDNLQFTANVSDSILRPAFQRLLRSTEDITMAQEALQLSLDISAATGKDLDTVANGLGKAYDGNAASLGRLGLGLDKATLKGADMVTIVEQLKSSFGGQSSAQADTLYGSVKGVQIAWDELIEAFGMGLTGATADDAKGLQDMEARLRAMQPQAQRAGENVRNLGEGALTLWDRMMGVSDVMERGDWGNFWEMMKAGASGSDQYFAALINTTQDVGGALDGMVYAAYDARSVMLDYRTAAEDATDANDRQVASLKRLQSQLDKMAGRQNIMEQRFGLQQLIAEGPGKSGKRKGSDGKLTQFTTLADRKEFAFSVAGQSRDLASNLLDAGKRKQARDALIAARQSIRGMNLPDAFQSNLLSTLTTPSGLRPRPTGGGPQTGRDVAMVNYNFYGGINVASTEAYQQAAKEAKRLASLSGDRYAGMAATGRGYRG